MEENDPLPTPQNPSDTPSPTRHTQITRNTHPVSMDTPTETPHDLYCLAKEYERRGRLSDAADLYLKASMNGHLSAMVSYASHLVKTDERAAFVWFRAAAERGDARAWAELGQLLARGRYFEVNAIDAARCWKRAAQMGDNTGKSALGLCYIRGFGVRKDAKRGVEIVRQVADVCNDVTAMKNLAWIYRHGKGVEKNVDQAEYWENRAKKQEKIVQLMTTREQALFGRRRRRAEDGVDQHELKEKLKAVTLQRKEPVAVDAAEAYWGVEEETREREEEEEQAVSAAKVGGTAIGAAALGGAAVSGAIVEGAAVGGATVGDAAVGGATLGVASLASEVVAAAKRRATSGPSIGGVEQGQDIELERRAVAELKATDPDPQLGAAVKDLSFTPNGKGEEHGEQHVEQVEVEAGELEAEQEGAREVAQQAVGGVADGAKWQQGVSSGVDAFDDVTDEQFITPETSLENENDEGDSVEPVAVAVGGALGLAQNRGEEAQEAGVERMSGGNSGGVARNGGGGLRAGIYESGTASVGAAAAQGHAARGLPEGELDARPIVDVGSRDRQLDESILDGDGQSGSQGGIQRVISYALNEGQDGDDGNDDLDEFEAADMQRITSEGPLSKTTYSSDEPAAGNATRGVAFGGEGGSRAPDARNQGGYGDDQVTHDELRDLLALYPKNPLRADSQVPLFNLLNAIQRMPVADVEGYEMLEKGNGFAKVVVAMISQYEDEFLQEQGLHSLVRILRATQSAKKEALILSTYADCYRSAENNPDAVVPKGRLGIDERSSGAVQAVVQAMRNHPKVRRVQLAGCAALGEAAAISSSCRSIAYEHGALTLIISCLRHRSTPAASSIHDIACRAITSFCNGKENFAFKEAFTSAGAVPELLSVLQLWGHNEDVSSELLATVTKDCCAALRSVTDGCSVASAQCVQSFAYHHLVKAMVCRRDDVAVCTLIIAAMASITRSAGSVAEKGLLDAKPLPEVLITMQAHSEQPAFIRKALDLMEALGSFGSMREEIVAAGGIPFASGIIQQGGTDSILLERACGVVERLCRANGKNQEIFLSNNGVMALTSLLKTHQAWPAVGERTLLALSSVCTSNAKCQEEAMKVGAPEQVMRAHATYAQKNASVVAASCSAMAAMVVPRNTAMAEEYAKHKAPEIVVRAMKRHADVVSVQENGSAAIASFCEADPRIISTLIKSGLSSALVIALQRFLDKPSAVVQIVRAMRAISNEASEDSFRFKQKLLTDRSNGSSLSEIFYAALSFHKKSLPDSANVIISICATVNRLCMRAIAFKNEIGKDGIVEELKRLIEKTAQFKQLGALQPVLATICTLVLDCEENKNRFHLAGGVEAILEVMQSWKNDTYVLEHCCAALRYSCNEHSGNCDEVKNHNGVRSILGVMELHPENVNVTLWCCLTLADLCKGDEELQSSQHVAMGIRKVVSAMSMFHSNSRFLASACEFLRAASVDNVENQERIVRLGGRTAIVKALETHPHDNTLTESGAYALLHVQDVQDARSSVDSQKQGGLIRRISQELRRSSSNKSARSSGKLGILGRKSKSFSSKRKQAAQELVADEVNPLAQTVAEERPVSRPSLINFSRGARSRSRKAKATAQPPEPLPVAEEEPSHDEEEEDLGADDGYGEYDPQPVQESSEVQID